MQSDTAPAAVVMQARKGAVTTPQEGEEMKHEFFTEDMTRGSGKRMRYTFKHKNRKCETVLFDLTVFENDGSKSSLPLIWKNRGFMKRVLESVLMVDVYVIDEKSNCRSDYNPTIDGESHKIDFSWIMEDTPENRDRLISEIERRAFA